MIDLNSHNAAISRRQFFGKSGTGLGAAALASMMARESAAGAGRELGTPDFGGKVKSVIYLSMIGAPSQFETFDYKPELEKRHKEDLTDFLKASGQRLTGMTAKQANFPAAKSYFQFNQHGQTGAWVSELLPHTAKMVDDLAIVKTMHTDAINHEPANQLICTGSMISGKPSMGAWLSYGLGSANRDLPDFVTMVAANTGKLDPQAISSRYWGSAFLPGKHAGVSLRSKGDPVLFLKDTAGVSPAMRRKMLDQLNKMNRASYELVGDPEIQTRMEQYEMAFRMQTSVPELTEVSGESEATLELYGDEVHTAGTFSRSSLMARRLVERGVRFVQIFHRGWDQHNRLPAHLPKQCRDVDQGCWALIQDLKQRGLLDQTLVVWGGEFGRTSYSQGAITSNNYGRDHHPRCFPMWFAGGGIKPGVYGETDDISFNPISDFRVHIRDLHALILHQLGIEHSGFIYPYQGLDQRLTGVVPARVPHELLL